MIGGWFVGNFHPTAYKTKKFEVSYKLHKKNEKWPKHYHKKADEINLILKGEMKIKNKIVKSGDIFVLKKKEIADPTFIKNTYIVCVKTASVKNDKFLAKNSAGQKIKASNINKKKNLMIKKAL